MFLKRFRYLAVMESAQSATELVVTDQAPTTSIRRVMGLKNTMAFLVEREKPRWSATKDRSSGWSGGVPKRKSADFSGTLRGRRAGGMKQVSRAKSNEITPAALRNSQPKPFAPQQSSSGSPIQLLACADRRRRFRGSGASGW